MEEKDLDLKNKDVDILVKFEEIFELEKLIFVEGKIFKDYLFEELIFVSYVDDFFEERYRVFVIVVFVKIILIEIEFFVEIVV